jgi:AcrR family transcriptional regulator
MGGTASGARREGLRERNRKRTATDLETAAVRLFADKGYDAVTIDDIAAEAGVSRRTFFRYFATKEDALFSDNAERIAELQEALGARPPDEPVLTALRHALLSMAGDYEEERERIFQRAKIIRTAPGLMGKALANQRLWEEAICDLVARRMGVDPGKDLRPGVVAATTVAALRAAMTLWVAGGGSADLPTLAAEALDLLDGGLQMGDPSAARRRVRRPGTDNPGT